MDSSRNELEEGPVQASLVLPLTRHVPFDHVGGSGHLIFVAEQTAEGFVVVVISVPVRLFFVEENTVDVVSIGVPVTLVDVLVALVSVSVVVSVLVLVLAVEEDVVVDVAVVSVLVLVLVVEEDVVVDVVVVVVLSITLACDPGRPSKSTGSWHL